MTQLREALAIHGATGSRHLTLAKVSGVIGAVVEGIRAGGNVPAVARKGDASHYSDLQG